MFDDLLCATTLATVGAVLAAGIWVGASDMSSVAGDPVAPVKAADPAGARPGDRAARNAMPVFDLPRVVVTGNRSRDGDMLAAEHPDTRSDGR